MSFLIKNAYGDAPITATTSEATLTPDSTPQNDIVGVVLPFVFIFVVFYFLILRPQQKKYKLHQAMVSCIQRGDKVVTSGGILGKVSRVDGEEGIVQVEIADNVIVKVMASTITTVVTDKPVNDNTIDKKEK